MPDKDDKTRKELREKLNGIIDERFESLEGRLTRDLEDQVSSAIKQGLAAAGRGSARAGESRRYKWMTPDGERARKHGEKGDFCMRIDLAPWLGASAAIGAPGAGYRAKSESDQTDVAGGDVTSTPPWYDDWEWANPFRAAGCRVIEASGGVVKLPNLADIVMNKEDAIPANRTVQGGVSSNDVVIENYAAETAFSDAAIMDIPSVSMAIQDQMMQAAMSRESTVCAAAFITSAKAAGATSVQTVATGVAAGLPTAANVVSKMSAMKLAVSPERRGMMPMFVLGEHIESRLELSALANEAGYAFRPREGIDRVLSWPARVTSMFDDGKTANDISAGCGNWGSGRACISRYLDLRSSNITRMGFTTFYVAHRCASAILNGKSLIALQSMA